MALTLREKEHWRERITRKIDQAIEALYAAEKPTFLDDVRTQARQRALESLGVAGHKAELDRLDGQHKELLRKRKDILRKIVARIDGRDVQSVSEYVFERDFKCAVSRREKFHFKDVLQTTELGRKVLMLEVEKEELLDTVWLATSTTQIKQLWHTVADVLRQEPTELQKEALRIEAAADSKE